MRVSLVPLGSRGDVEPYVALGRALAAKGHAVRVATCEPFRDFVTSNGLEYERLAGDIKEVVGDRGRAELASAGANPIRAFRALREHVGPLVREANVNLPRAIAGADVVIGHLLAPAAASVAERTGARYIDASYVPVFPTRAFAHPGAPPDTRGGLACLASHLVAEQLFFQAFRADVNALRRSLGMGRSPLLGPDTWPLRRRPPKLVAVSPEIVPRPSDWPAHVHVTGHFQLDAPADYAPPPALEAFLSAGEPPVYVGFGSMTLERPEEATRAVIAAVRAAGKRALLSAGWGGLAEIGPTSDDVFFVGDVPHGYLFSRVAGVVHHGGAGTTASAFRAGVPQMAVPFLADQPFWGHRISALGAGPRPLPIAHLDVVRLRDRLRAFDFPSIRRRAAEIGSRVRAERGPERAVEIIERLAA
ncbi:MAG: glycosyltransferase [Polyangiaceae bacterium]